jgi:hypothetical protein
LYDIQVQAAVASSSSSSWGENSHHKDAAMIILLCNVPHSDDDRYDTAATGQTHRQILGGRRTRRYITGRAATSHQRTKSRIASSGPTGLRRCSWSPPRSMMNHNQRGHDPELVVVANHFRPRRYKTQRCSGEPCVPIIPPTEPLLLPRDSFAISVARSVSGPVPAVATTTLPTSSPREVEVLRSLF